MTICLTINFPPRRLNNSIFSAQSDKTKRRFGVSDKQNTDIVKYTKKQGEQVAVWQDTTGLVHHLNSGIILNGKLYCTLSNYPQAPMASSIEIFDPETLQHTGSHSFGIEIGSATWIDRYDGYWYVAFAHYTGRGSETPKDNRWTQLVKYTADWQRVGAWIFPPELIKRFGDRSNSGGFITDEGSLYITGHDNPEVYQLDFPKMGYTLQWTDTFTAPIEGQGIASDPEDPHSVYWISRQHNQVIKLKITR